jgi:hypothetical protein
MEFLYTFIKSNKSFYFSMFYIIPIVKHCNFQGFLCVFSDKKDV